MSAQASTVQDLLAGIIKAVQFLERIHRLQTYIPDRIHELLLGRLEGLVQRMRLDAMARGRPATALNGSGGNRPVAAIQQRLQPPLDGQRRFQVMPPIAE